MQNESEETLVTLDLTLLNHLVVKQRFEGAEFFGFETRNKYDILGPDKYPVAYAAEQGKGFLGFLLRQFLGHWRSFEISIFSPGGSLVLRAVHPFRFYFQRLDIFDSSGKYLGGLEKRFSILTKRFDVHNADGITIMEVASPFWRLWTFPFRFNNQDIAVVQKKWSGVFNESFTDKDTFHIGFVSPTLTNEERQLLLVSAIFIDLQYFESKAGR